VLALLAVIDDPSARATTTAERAFLRALGGGCAAPVAAHAVVKGDDVRMEALVSSVDGKDVVRVSGEGAPEELGTRLAREALTAGADRILAVIRG
jgi:hydroxymethylbilane synthase